METRVFFFFFFFFFLLLLILLFFFLKNRKKKKKKKKNSRGVHFFFPLKSNKQMTDDTLQEDEIVKLTQQFLHFAEREERTTIVSSVKEFQTQYRGTFSDLKIDENSEHKHEWREVYNNYVAILESTAEKFCKRHDLSNEQLLQILGHIKGNMPDVWLPFAVWCFT